MEERKEETKTEAREISSDLQTFVREVVERYQTMPIIPIFDVELGNRRVFHIGENKDEIKRFRTKSNCNRCYGLGYTSIFYSNESKYGGQPLLDFCSCLKEVKEKANE